MYVVLSYNVHIVQDLNMYIVQNKGNKVSAYRERQTVYELLNRFALIAGGGGGIYEENMLFFTKICPIF